MRLSTDSRCGIFIIAAAAIVSGSKFQELPSSSTHSANTSSYEESTMQKNGSSDHTPLKQIRRRKYYVTSPSSASSTSSSSNDKILEHYHQDREEVPDNSIHNTTEMESLIPEEKRPESEKEDSTLGNQTDIVLAGYTGESEENESEKEDSTLGNQTDIVLAGYTGESEENESEKEDIALGNEANIVLVEDVGEAMRVQIGFNIVAIASCLAVSTFVLGVFIHRQRKPKFVNIVEDYSEDEVSEDEFSEITLVEPNYQNLGCKDVSAADVHHCKSQMCTNCYQRDELRFIPI